MTSTAGTERPETLVLVPVIGVVAGFTGLRIYEHLLRRRESKKAAG
jgi:hypothetical protein